MEITQQVRDYAAKLNRPVEEAAADGMAEMSEKFRDLGGAGLCADASEGVSNGALERACGKRLY